MKTLVLVVILCSACGDNIKGPISYTDPSGGKLRLIQDPGTQSGSSIVLDLVVGDAALTGYSAGFDLPIDDTKVTFKAFTPGTALSAGSAPLAAQGLLVKTGPLAHDLVTAQSQKASGDGAITTDTTLQPGAILYSFELVGIKGVNGVVFDGTATGFVLPSGGMRDRTGTTVVDAKDVAIGKLEVHL
jgi:hypothetical protein